MNLNVIVIGAAGRMGKRLIANVVKAEDMTLVGAVDRADCADVGKDAGTLGGAGEGGVAVSADLSASIEAADAVIDFGTGGVVEHVELAVSNDVSVVIGTTSLSTEEKTKLRSLAERGGRIVFAPNMSVGVNLLFHLSAQVAKVLGDDYDIEIVETHHNQKKDAPSGTAARLAEVLADARNLSYEHDVRHGREGMVGARPRNEIGVHALRAGDVVGEHTVMFATEGERVELCHKASSRDTFAKGALRAVRFLATASPGLYDMQDVLGLR